MNAHSVTFDKLVYLDRLKAAGVPDDVARAHAEGLDQALRESVATKSDLEKVEASVRSELAKFEASLRGDITKLDASLRGEIGKVDAKIDVTAADLRTEIANSANRLAAEFNSTIYKAIGVVGAMIAASSVVAHFWK